MLSALAQSEQRYRKLADELEDLVTGRDQEPGPRPMTASSPRSPSASARKTPCARRRNWNPVGQRPAAFAHELQQSADGGDGNIELAQQRTSRGDA